MVVTQFYNQQKISKARFSRSLASSIYICRFVRQRRGHMKIYNGNLKIEKWTFDIRPHHHK